ncbi:2'-5' RNA ligase family protein [Gracilimonas amylolytica]|uniref:2'-5' RNA ligase family protein n=1 Tax=Gracilimonas amylolytica TaxID=1749045 RepID=UPI000CD84830|nr:2'-5' RNA ligase family protein [Gracilimonas amylolytica]
MTQFDLKEHYNRSWVDSINKIESGGIKPDYRIDEPEDDRYGLTLIVRPSLEIRKAVNQVFQQIRIKTPDQYYYPVSDLHLTLLTIVSCQSGFDPEQIRMDEYVSILKPILENTDPFQIEFKGITASTEAIMVCGYPEEDSLNTLRNKIRKAFKGSDLFQTIDKRYTIQTAHMTAMRFSKPVDQLTKFVEQLNSIKHMPFGSDTTQECHLVTNDWYQRADTRRTIETFRF